MDAERRYRPDWDALSSLQHTCASTVIFRNLQSDNVAFAVKPGPPEERFRKYSITIDGYWSKSSPTAYDNVGRLIGTTTHYSFLPRTTFTNSYR